MDLVAALFLGLVLGLVLGYLSALPRVKRLEKESVLILGWKKDSALAQELSLSRLRREQALAKSQLEQRHTAQE